MRVLHVININGFGGAEKLLLQLLPALNKEMEIEALILHKEGSGNAANEISAGLRAQGIEVKTIIYKKIVEKGIFTKMAINIQEGKYDLIHSHLKYADAWISWLKFRKKIDLPVVSTMHGYKDEYENRNGFKIVKSLFVSPYFLISKWIYRQVDGFIMISNIVSSFFNQSGLIGKKRQVIIYHGYVSNLPTPCSEMNEPECRLAIPGRLLKRKGHQYAIDALEKVALPGQRISLHIYGEGPERKTIEKLIAERKFMDRVFLHGYVGNLVERLREADIVIIPSLWEGFGLVFLDAFEAGSPVVAFDLPAANEIIDNGRNGLLATPYDSDSLAEKIKTLCENPQLRRTLSEQASTDLRNRFSMKDMANNYKKFYGEVIENRSKS